MKNIYIILSSLFLLLVSMSSSVLASSLDSDSVFYLNLNITGVAILFLVFVIMMGYFCIFLSYPLNALGSFGLLVAGFILLFNGFNLLISVFLIFIALVFIFRE